MEKRIDLEWEVLLQCEPFGNTEAYQANEMQTQSLANFDFVTVCLFIHFFSLMFSLRHSLYRRSNHKGVSLMWCQIMFALTLTALTPNI